MTNVELLSKAIKKSGLRRRFIADSLEMGYDSFYKKCNGKTQFKASEIKALSELLHLSLEEMQEIFLS